MTILQFDNGVAGQNPPVLVSRSLKAQLFKRRVEQLGLLNDVSQALFFLSCSDSFLSDVFWTTGVETSRMVVVPLLPQAVHEVDLLHLRDVESMKADVGQLAMQQQAMQTTLEEQQQARHRTSSTLPRE